MNVGWIKIRDWIRRHKVWSAFIAFAMFATIVGQIGNALESETTKQSSEQSSDKPSAAASPTATKAATSPPPSPRPSATKQPSGDPRISACSARKPKGGEIYVRYITNGDDPPNSVRLGAGYVWNFRDQKCVNTTQFALLSDPGLPGYCTQVGKVRDNPGYDENRIPSRPLKVLSGSAGDC